MKTIRDESLDFHKGMKSTRNANRKTFQIIFNTLENKTVNLKPKE